MLRTLIAVALCAVAGFGGTASAQQAEAKFPLELNRLEQDGDICRVYLLVQNPDPIEISAFKLDLVFFDKEGIIRNRLYVELGPLAASKTAVRLFDIPGAECGALGSILVNDVVSCADAAGDKLSCLKRLDLSSRTDATLRY